MLYLGDFSFVEVTTGSANFFAVIKKVICDCPHRFISIERFFFNCFTYQGRDGIANHSELVRACDGKLKPIRETLDAGGFTRRERAVLRRVNEHQPVLAQVRNDGAAWMPAALPGVAVFEAGFVVRKLKFYGAVAHGGGGVFAFTQPGKVARVAFAVRTGNMIHQFRGAVSFEDVHQVVQRGLALMFHMFAAPGKIVVALVVPAAGTQDRQGAHGRPPPGARLGARRRLEFRQEVGGQIGTHANEKLATAFLRHTQFPRVFNLSMHAVTQQPRLLLDGGEILPTSGGTDAENIFHHENARLEITNVAEKFAKKLAALVGYQPPFAVIRAVALPGRAETLAGRTAYNHVHLIDTKLRGELIRRKLREVFVKRQSVFRHVGFECLDGFIVEINRGENLETGALHSQAENAAAAK